MIQDKIDKIKDYFRSMEVAQGVSFVKVEFDEKWSVYPSEDGKIKVTKVKNNPKMWYYFGNINEVSFDEIFDLIDNTIITNLNANKKLELLNMKFNELKEIFANESLETLKTLKFVFKPKRKKIDKKNTIIANTNNITENKQLENVSDL